MGYAGDVQARGLGIYTIGDIGRKNLGVPLREDWLHGFQQREWTAYFEEFRRSFQKCIENCP